MDQSQTSRRSASHGAHDRSDSANAPPSGRMPSSRPLFSRSLRSVNENPSFLTSPGPLESMLKTTTETGNIGFFSIRPTRPNPSYQGLVRSRSVFGEPGFVRPSMSGGGSGFSHRHDRRRLPSYRDTTSEIISMYGSESQRSASSSLPALDDYGQRSYSMTSCSSRPPPRRKSSGIMHNQFSGNLQRPRSPFPYPTRLKRPGVRPSSPALTEHGVDYSKMVGIDRASYRTIHGSYKPTYAPTYGRRIAHEASRFAAHNTGMPTYRPGYEGVGGSQFPQGMPSCIPQLRGYRYNNRYDGTMSEHSVRSSSLTSIVDMYRPPSCAPSARSCPLWPQPSRTFYYDYSEDFDRRPGPATYSSVRMPPISPIPTRAPSARRAKVLNEGYESQFQNMTGPEFSYSAELPPSEEPCHQLQYREWDASDCQPHSQQDENNNPHESCVPNHKISGHGFTYPSSTVAMLDPRGDTETRFQPQGAQTIGVGPNGTSAESPRLRTNRISTVSTPDAIVTYQDFKTSATVHNASSSVSTTNTHRGKFYSIEPGLSDLASLVQQMDLAAELVDKHNVGTSILDADSQAGATPASSLRGTLDRPGMDQSPCKDYRRRLSTTVGSEAPNSNELTSRHRGHRRNPAVPRISTQFSGTAEIGSAFVTQQEGLVVLSPQPKSPINRLRLQISMPHLMKELPPLPNGSIKSESCLDSFSIEDARVPAKGLPSEHPVLNNETLTTHSKSNSNMDLEDIGADAKHCKNGESDRVSEGANFRRIGVPASRSRSGQEGGLFEGLTPESENRSPRSGHGKLKLRVSRGALVRKQGDSSPSDRKVAQAPVYLVYPNPDGSPSSVNDLTGTVTALGEGLGYRQEASFILGSRQAQCQAQDASVIQSSDCLGRGIESKIPGITILAEQSTALAVSSDARSFLSEESSGSRKPTRGLRKRFSDLRMRIAEPRFKFTEPTPSREAVDNMLEMATTANLYPKTAVGFNNDIMYEIPEDLVGSDGQIPSPSRGFRGRVSRWMRAARHAVVVACAGSRKRG